MYVREEERAGREKAHARVCTCAREGRETEIRGRDRKCAHTKEREREREIHTYVGEREGERERERCINMSDALGTGWRQRRRCRNSHVLFAKIPTQMRAGV